MNVRNICLPFDVDCTHPSSQAIQVALRRHEEASMILDSQSDSMDRIDTVTMHLKLVMKIGKPVAQVSFIGSSSHLSAQIIMKANPIAQAAVGIANVALEVRILYPPKKRGLWTSGCRYHSVRLQAAQTGHSGMQGAADIQ